MSYQCICIKKSKICLLPTNLGTGSSVYLYLKNPKCGLPTNSETGSFPSSARSMPVISSLSMSGKNRTTNSGVYGGVIISRTCRTTERERNVLFNDALNTFYLRLYGIRHMVKDHSDSEKGNPLLPHRLLLSARVL